MKRWMLAMALAAPLALGAREVRVGSVVCNPGARVRVPVALDDASGASGAAVALAFDPLALTLESVRPGALAEAFGERFPRRRKGPVRRATTRRSEISRPSCRARLGPTRRAAINESILCLIEI